MKVKTRSASFHLYTRTEAQLQSQDGYMLNINYPNISLIKPRENIQIISPHSRIRMNDQVMRTPGTSKLVPLHNRIRGCYVEHGAKSIGWYNHDSCALDIKTGLDCWRALKSSWYFSHKISILHCEAKVIFSKGKGKKKNLSMTFCPTLWICFLSE